jgi:serine/threonine-protein kinase
MEPCVARLPRLIPRTVFAESFRVIDIVGQGSMGSVYEVERVSDGERLALKLVDLSGRSDPRAARRFEREVQAGRSIASEHVARVVDSGEDPARGIGWVAMELVHGRELYEFVRDGAPLAPELAERLMAQLFDALSAAHAAGIVHRDLKPENVRVGERAGEPWLKVLDFGIAKSLTGLEVSGTTPGLGTPLWTAPEQAKDGYVPAPSADVWALGLLSFFVLTGKQYWKNADKPQNILELTLEILKQPIEPATDRARELGVESLLPEGYSDWFSRAVNRDPAARFPNAGEAASAFARLFEPPALEASRAEGRSRPVERTGLLLLFLVLTCAAMGYGIYLAVASGRH